MSIAESVLALQNELPLINAKIIEKGGIVGQGDGYLDVVKNIDTITTGGGITPTGQIQITENGTFNVLQFAEAIVNVSGGSSSIAKVTEKHLDAISSSSKTVTIEHELGRTPDFVVIIYKDFKNLIGNCPRKTTIGGFCLGNAYSNGWYVNTSGVIAGHSTSPTVNNITETTFDFVIATSCLAGDYIILAF